MPVSRGKKSLPTRASRTEDLGPDDGDLRKFDGTHRGDVDAAEDVVKLVDEGDELFYSISLVQSIVPSPLKGSLKIHY